MMPTVRLTLGFAAVIAVGCDTGTTTIDETDGQTTETTMGGGLPAPQSLQTPVDAKLVERIVPVKLPSMEKVKEGKAQTFRFGRENEHSGWIAQLPERAQLVSVAYAGGKIFVGGGFGSSSMYALNALTGERDWSRQALVDPGPTSAVVDDDELAYNTFSCSMEVLQSSTGKVLWTKWLGSETPNPPAFTGKLVIASHPGGDGFQLSAYQRKNGNDVWSSSIDNHILSVPVVAGDAVYVSTASGSLYKIGLDGKRQWHQSISAASAPWIDGNDVHLAVREGNKEVQVTLDAATGKRIGTGATAKVVNDIPADAGEGTWSFEGSRPVVKDGVVFTAMGDRVEARDAKSNALKWTRKYIKGVGTRDIGQVIVAGNLAIVSTHDGKVVGLDRDTGEQRMAFDFGTQVASQPVIAEGWMYVATSKGQVVAFDLGQKSMDGWHMWGGNAQHNL
jgi:Ca-activated chloride channel family protein